MEQDIQVTVLSATPRVVGTKTIYDIALSDGNTYSTFDAAIFAKATSLVNQPASARVKVGPNPKKPQYTNYYLNDIAPQGQLPPPGVTPTVIGQPQAAAAVAAVQKAPSTFNGGMTPEREQKIVKQSSFSTAFNFVGHILSGSGDIEAAKEKAHKLAAELYGQVFGEEKQPEAAGAAVSDSDGIPW